MCWHTYASVKALLLGLLLVICWIEGHPSKCARTSSGKRNNNVGNYGIVTFSVASWGTFASDCAARNWNDARVYCENRGGRLVESLRNSADIFAANLPQLCPQQNKVDYWFWMGGLSNGGGAPYLWGSDGAPVGPFSPPEPSNWGGMGGVMYSYAKAWNSLSTYPAGLLIDNGPLGMESRLVPVCEFDSAPCDATDCSAAGTANVRTDRTRSNSLGCCECGTRFSGRRCDQCSAQYMDPPLCGTLRCVSMAANCLAAGTDTFLGTDAASPACCGCKPRVKGNNCNQCEPGWTPFPACDTQMCTAAYPNGYLPNDSNELYCKGG